MPFEPLTDEQIWGVPSDELPRAETPQEIEDSIRFGCTWPDCGECEECHEDDEYF